MVECVQQQSMADTTESLKSFSSAKCPSVLQPSSACCSVCASNPGKYKCPRCSSRTCSVLCFKTHKESEKCVAQSDHWTKIHAHSQFDDEVSISDQQFLQKIQAKVKTDKRTELVPQKEQKKASPKIQPSTEQRFLLQNAQMRRIWLHLDNAPTPSGSHCDRFSDTIFWTCTVKFLSRCSVNGSRQIGPPADADTHSNATGPSHAAPTHALINNKPIVDYNGSDDDEYFGASEQDDEDDDGGGGDGAEGSVSGGCSDSSMDDDEQEQQMQLECIDFTVERIPENIRVVTLLRQFLRPKPHGPVVTLSQIDMTKMGPFISAAHSLLSSTLAPTLSDKENADKLMVYLEMSVSDEKEERPKSGLTDDEQTEEEAVRYYVVDPTRTILDNLRNRHVNGHPTFVVVLRRDTEFGDLDLPLMREEEQKQMEEKRRERGNAFSERPKWQQQRNSGRMGRSNNFNWRNRRGMRGNNNHQGHAQQQHQWHSAGGGNGWAQHNQRQNAFAAVSHCQPMNFAAFHPYQQPMFNQNIQMFGPSPQQPRGGWNMDGGNYYNNYTMSGHSGRGFS